MSLWDLHFSELLMDGKDLRLRENGAPRCIEGWEQKACHHPSPLVSCRNSLIAILVAVGCYLPFTNFSPHFQLYRPLSGPDSAVSFPFIVKHEQTLC